MQTKKKNIRWPLVTSYFTCGHKELHNRTHNHTSSTSSQCTPSPVYPSGQGAHWKPPDSVRMHIFCLKQVPGRHWLKGWGCITNWPEPPPEDGSGPVLVGLPPRPKQTHGQIFTYFVEMWCCQQFGKDWKASCLPHARHSVMVFLRKLVSLILTRKRQSARVTVGQDMCCLNNCA